MVMEEKNRVCNCLSSASPSQAGWPMFHISASFGSWKTHTQIAGEKKDFLAFFMA